MKIRTTNSEIIVNSIIGTKMVHDDASYPALTFILPEGISTEDINSILSGKFIVLDDADNVVGTYDGYTTLKEVSVTVGKITSQDERIVELENEIATVQAANAELQTAIDIIVGGNAE